MKQKKVLAILGSPRSEGNTAQLLAASVTAASESGAVVETVRLYESNLGYCRGCMSCKNTTVCILDDGLSELRDKLKECDLVVLAAPTYFANVPAVVKNFFDRLVGAVMDDNSSPIPKPRLSKAQGYFLLTACNTPFPFDRLAGQSSGALRAMKEFFRVSGMRYRGSVIYAGTRGKGSPPEKLLRKIRRKTQAALR